MNGEEATYYRRVVRVRPTKKLCCDEETGRTGKGSVPAEEEHGFYSRRESIKNDETYDIFVKVIDKGLRFTVSAVAAGGRGQALIRI